MDRLFMKLRSVKSGSLCVFEYNKRGSCRHGLDCRFQHQVSEAQRTDPRIQEDMEKKSFRLKINSDAHEPSRNSQFYNNIRSRYNP